MSKYFDIARICEPCQIKGIYCRITVENNKEICSECGNTSKFLYAKPENLKLVLKNNNSTYYKLEHEKEFEEDMKRSKRMDIVKIYTEDCLRYEYSLKVNRAEVDSKFASRSSTIILDSKMVSVPKNNEEKYILTKDEKSKELFCWFCLTCIKSEKVLPSHLQGNAHSINYNSDKKRIWFFKMPPSSFHKDLICNHSQLNSDVKNLSTVNGIHPYSQSNEFNARHEDICHKAHSISEYEEMVARLYYRKFMFNFRSEFDDHILEVQKISPWRSDLVGVIIPHFLHSKEVLHDESQKIMIQIKKFTNIQLISVYLRNDESRPFFKLFQTNKTQKLSYKDQYMEFTEQNNKILFGLELFPMYSSTYHQLLEFHFVYQKKDLFFQKSVRADIAVKSNFEMLRNLWNTYQHVVITEFPVPTRLFPIENKKDNSDSDVISMDIRNQLFRICSDENWLSVSVKSWNYVYWLRYMCQLEELEQRGLLCDVKLEPTFNLTDYLVKGESTFWIDKKASKNLYAQSKFDSKFDNGKCKDLIFKTVIKAYLIFDSKYYELGVESKSYDEIILNVQKKHIKDYNLKTGDQIDSNFLILQFNKQRFIRYYKTLNNLPNNDSLEYCPLPCPAFQRLPYGESEDQVQFKCQLTLTKEQKRLPNLILRKIEKDEMSLPFVLEGAFGTGKTQVLGSTVIHILNRSIITNIRILICCRSYSAAEVFVDILQKSKISSMKLVYPTFYREDNFMRAKIDGKIKIFNDELTTSIWDINKIFISTLDSVSDSFQQYQKSFDSNSPMFHYIFVDEAAQVLEIEAISVYEFGNKSTKFVFTGDVYQLRPPLYFSNLKKFSIPIVSRLHKLYANNCDYQICLKDVFRTHSKIVDFLSKAIYKTKLESKLSDIPNYIKSLSNTVKFIDYHEYGITKCDYDMEFSSHYNLVEVELVLKSVKFYQKISNFQKEDYRKILVCTPFYAQIKRIRQKLKSENFGAVTVEMHSNIQGKEFDAVIISTVLTFNSEKCNLQTFHSSKNMINMVISRAKYYVEVIGDKSSLCSSSMKDIWNTYLNIAKS